MNPPPQLTEVPLERVLADVLADLAFLVGESGDLEPAPGAVWIAAHVEYRGPRQGVLRCWCTETFATQLAANLLGLDADSDEACDRRLDAVCELLNVLCGQFVTARYGVSAVFNLSIPAATVCAETPALPREESVDVCTLMVDGAPLISAHETIR